jgi:hypothetical protein
MAATLLLAGLLAANQLAVETLPDGRFRLAVTTTDRPAAMAEAMIRLNDAAARYCASRGATATNAELGGDPASGGRGRLILSETFSCAAETAPRPPALP